MKLTKETEKWSAYFEDSDYGQLKNESYSERKYKEGLLVFEFEEKDCFQEDRTSKKRELFYDNLNRIKKEINTEIKDIGTGIIEIYEIDYDYNGNSYRKTTKKKYSGYKDVLEKNIGDIQLVDNLKEVDEIEEILEVKYEDERKISERFVSIKNETNWTTAYNYIEDVLDNYYLESIIGPHKIDGHDLFKSYYKYQNGKLIKEKHFNKEGVVLLYKEHKDGEPILIIEYAKIPYNVKSPDYIETRISNNLITDERYYHRKVNLTEGEKNELKLTKQITFIYNENKNIVSKNYYQFNDKEEKVLVKKETTVYTECKIRDNKERIIKNYQLPIEIISLIRVENEGGESAEFEETSKTIKIYYPNSINLFEEKYFIENKLLKHVFYEYQNDNCIEKRTRHYNIANDTLDSSELESIDYDVSGDVTFHLMIKISGNEIVNKTTKHFYYSND